MNQDKSVPAEPQAVDTVWHDQLVWSVTANQLKARLSAWRNIAVIAGVLGAFLETLSASLPGLDDKQSWIRSLIALAGTAVLAIVPFILKVKASSNQLSDWVRARSAAEALKENIYRYLVGAPPFGPSPSPADLLRQAQAVKDAVQDLNIHAALVQAPQRSRPAALTPEDYVAQRVNGQIDGYYRPKARRNAEAAQRFHNLEFVLGFVAVVMSALATGATAAGFPRLTVLGPWVAVVTTAGAAVTAYLAACRFDLQAITFYGTAERLQSLREGWLADPNRLDPKRVAKFVDDCEHAISTENEAWLAELTRTKSQD